MISALIFSRNRAMQLEALLSSIQKHAAHLFSEITVLYRADTALHRLAYHDCFKEHREARPREELAFADDVRDWIRAASELVCFLVDDDVFYRDAPGDAPTVAITPLGLACYSFRVGPWSWRWDQREGDYAYPLALDGHIYERDLISPHLDFAFHNPTQLEANLASRAHEILLPNRPYMAGTPCLVGIPANRVSESSGCEYDGRAEWHPDRLCERFLDGERIDLEAMAFSAVEGAHQVVPFAFRSKRARIAL